MNKKSLLLLIFLIIGNINLELSAKNLYIHTKDGKIELKLLSNIQKLTFEDTDMIIYGKDGSSELQELSTISKLCFKDLTDVTNETDITVSDNQNIVIYPNPAINYIQIKNLPAGISNYYIHRADSKVVLQATVTQESNLIDVSELPIGIYLIRINFITLKFVKI